MIQYIKGIYTESGKDYMVIDNNGFGVKVFVPSSAFSRAPNYGQTMKLYTYLHVREDVLALYGFPTKEELDMFELLISVSGVGPKAGLSILSVLPPDKLGLSIIGGDTKSLTLVPGIGSKMAHRIILELKDKIDKDDITEAGIDNMEYGDNAAGEAVKALIALGYSAVEAGSAVNKLSNKYRNAEDIIKAALKSLAG